MRTALHTVITLCFLLMADVSYSQHSAANVEQNYTTNIPVSVADIINLTPSQTLSYPQTVANKWLEKPVPLTHYSNKEREIQRLVNEHASNEIVTFSSPENRNEWTEIDFDPITPYTWKWVDFELENADGSHSTAQLRRPNWWIAKMKANTVGNKVYLDLPQMGMQGTATVARIRVNQYDSRLEYKRNDTFSCQPITGKFIHQSNNVFHIYFEDHNDSLGVTGNHLLWSSDKNGWIPVQQLKPGENIKTDLGITKIKKLKKQHGSRIVYNLEVYRNHNYHVSLNSVLAHNECWNTSWDEVLSDWKKIAYDAGGPHAWVSARTENGVRRVVFSYEHALPDLDMNVVQNVISMIRLEERTAIGEGAEAIVIKVMMPSEIYQTDNLIISDLFKAGRYKDIQFYSEHGMNWMEATKGNLPDTPTTPIPDSNIGVSTTIPDR